MGCFITFATLKGGTGKTMLSYQLAGLLAIEHTVLVVDADPQADMSANWGIRASANATTIADVLTNRRTSAEDVIVRRPCEELPNLDVLPASAALTDVEPAIAGRSNRERLFENWLLRNRDTVEPYDYAICDVNPTMSIVNRNILAVADSIVLVTDVDLNSLRDAQEFARQWEDCREDMMIDDNIAALIVNNFDARQSMVSDMRDYIQSDIDLSRLNVSTWIPARACLKRSVAACKPLVITAREKSERETLDLLIALMVELQERGVF